MLKYVFAKIKRLFQKNRKQNSIQVGTVENGNIYQDSIVKIENPAIAINHVKDNPEDLKITLDSISNVLLKPSKALPHGYQVVVNMRDGKADIHSEPVNEKARQQYPQRVKATAKIDIPVGMSFQEALNRARISQTPINVEMLDMQKMIGDNIDIAKRLLMIENQYGIQFPTDQELSDEDIELIGFLSNSIMNKPSGFTWDNFNATANFHVIEPDGINNDARLEFKETVSITILGQKITDLLVSVELESVRIANLDSIKEAVKTHKTEQIQISLVPGNRGNHGTRIALL